MKLFKTTLTPHSQFATILKGDTLFGQLCWSIVHLYGSDRLTTLLKRYDESPFIIISDAFSKGYLPKPKMPSKYLGEKSEDKKTNRKKVWLSFDDLMRGNYTSAISDKELKSVDEYHSSVQNSINYKTFNTGIEPFSPYGIELINYTPKDIYILLDESQISKEELYEALSFMGEYGYGKKSTIGKGRFMVSELEDIDIVAESRAYMALGPFKPKVDNAKELFYETFVRFGKMGANRATKNAFKVPQLLADTASVVCFEEKRSLQYIGESIRNVSNYYKDAVQQGYAIVLPIQKGCK